MNIETKQKRFVFLCFGSLTRGKDTSKGVVVSDTVTATVSRKTVVFRVGDEVLCRVVHQRLAGVITGIDSTGFVQVLNKETLEGSGFGDVPVGKYIGLWPENGNIRHYPGGHIDVSST